MNIYGNQRRLSPIVLAGSAKTKYTVTKLQQNLTKSGDVMNGILDMGEDSITGVLNHASTRNASTTADSMDTLKVANAGVVMSNNLEINLNKITDVADPVVAQDVVTKNYLDTIQENTKYLDILRKSIPRLL